MFKDYCYLKYYETDKLSKQIKENYKNIESIALIKYIYEKYNYVQCNIKNTEIIDFCISKSDPSSIGCEINALKQTIKNNNFYMFKYILEKYIKKYCCNLTSFKYYRIDSIKYNQEICEYIYLKNPSKENNILFIEYIINNNFSDELLFKYYNKEYSYNCIFYFDTITQEKFDFIITKKKITNLFLIKHCVVKNKLLNYKINDLNKKELKKIIDYILTNCKQYKYRDNYKYKYYPFDSDIMKEYFVHMKYNLTYKRLENLFLNDRNLIKYCDYDKGQYAKLLLSNYEKDLLKQEIKNNNLKFKDLVDGLVKFPINKTKSILYGIRDLDLF